MRPSLIAIVSILATSSSAQATSALSFEAEGYVVDIVVGNDSQPAVAGLSFAAPDSVRGIEISLRHLKIDVFDTKQKILLLRFMNPGDPALPKDFSLAVKNDVGILKIDGKSVSGRFLWGV